MKRGAFIFLGLIMLLCSACNQASEYRLRVKRELSRNVKYDTLLLNVRFGMNKREFFAHCWELNKKGFIGEGVTNATVNYTFDRYGKEFSVDFYPKFHKGKVNELPVEYKYSAFAPWTPKYSIDTLLSEVLVIHKEEYGEDFMEIKSKDKGSAFTRIDGNRRITIHKNIYTNSVDVFYFDLLSDNNNTIVNDDN